MNQPGPYTTRDLIFSMNQDPDHPAIETPGYLPLTYRDLRDQILSVVQSLNARGFHRNDRIAVIMPAGPETAVMIIAVMAGFTCVLLNPHYREQEYGQYLSQIRVKAIVVQQQSNTAAIAVAASRNIPVIELLPAHRKAGIFTLHPAVVHQKTVAEFATPSDISHVFLTSGTTVNPKIVAVSQRQSFISRQRNYRPSQITCTDRSLHIMPYYHAAGIGAPLLGVLLAGGTVICTKEFIPPDFLSLLKTCRPTFYSAGPALHQGILRELKKVPPEKLKNTSLRFIRSGSASLPGAVLEELETLFGVPVIDTYASSETGPISVNYPPKRGSVGIPVIDNLKILKENGENARPYEPGEIVVSGETVFCGYENASDETRASFTDGWFKTGDIGYLDHEGYLFLSGRKKELINKGGEKISPAEIDAVLLTHRGVKEAMAFAVPDPVLGEDVAAMVVPADSRVTEPDLRLFLLERLVPFKVPGRIYFVDEIPKSPAGKPLRHAGSGHDSQR